MIRTLFHSWVVACKAFWRALCDPLQAEEWLTPSSSPSSVREDSHLRLLSLLQAEGRLLDFLQENITPFTDAQIGAAVRQIHADSQKSLEEFVTCRPLLTEVEGALITLPSGYDKKQIRVIGRVQGSPPYTGIVRHRGWKAHKLSLPKRIGEEDPSVVYPAEVEVQGV